jgi:phosphoribosylamine--glycine ligase
MIRIAFAGTDGRSLLWALVAATATSENHRESFEGIVVRGAPGMPKFTQLMGWPVSFIPTASNSVQDYADAVIDAFRRDAVDVVVPMPEALLFDGLVDQVVEAGFGDRVIGLEAAGAFIEGDKIACKKLCREAGIPVAQHWCEVDAKDYPEVLSTCLSYIHESGGAVLKYPYSAGGKGARIILNSWEIREVYDTLIKDYRDAYRKVAGKKNPWPLLIESLMAGVEISFLILVDAGGGFQILPTSMDYPERFEGPASKTNPITGGVGAISPHPMETREMMAMVEDTIARPLIEAMRRRKILRPCILYPGCFVSFTADRKPSMIRVSEINIRPGEPEAQPTARRLRNLGPMIRAMVDGELDNVPPEVRQDQISISMALVTGPGGPDGQKGYPWSCTRGEAVEIDFKYMRRKGIQVIPSAMDYVAQEDRFKSDGTRVAFINGNMAVKQNESRGTAAERLRNRLLAAFDNGKIRVIPREDPAGNRLDLRRDVGRHFLKAEELFGD